MQTQPSGGKRYGLATLAASLPRSTRFEPSRRPAAEWVAGRRAVALIAVGDDHHRIPARLQAPASEARTARDGRDGHGPIDAASPCTLTLSRDQGTRLGTPRGHDRRARPVAAFERFPAG